MHCRSALLFSVLVSFISGPIAAQTTATPEQATPGTESPAATFKVNARTVLVDVVVTDNKNRAVPGLKKEDFQVFEDGKPQAISFFEANFADVPEAASAQGDAVPAAAVPAVKPPALPPGTFTNVPTVAPNDAVNVLLMDSLNTAEGDQSYVHKEMVRYLATLPPRIRIAVFLLSERLRIIQGFTQDGTVLRAAIKRLAANPNTSSLLSTMESSAAENSATNMIYQAALDTGSVQLAQSAQALQQFVGQQNTFADNQRTMMTMEALQQIARYLAGIPGRKNLIWFVGMFPHCLAYVADQSTAGDTSTLANGGCPYDERMKKTVAMLASARVSIYPIDARGLTTHTLYSAESPALSLQPATVSSSKMAVQAPFAAVIGAQADSLNQDLKDNGLNIADEDELAKATGGKATFGSNNFLGAITSDIDNGSRYYTIAYIPANHSEVGKERKIEVKSVSGSYKLAYRRSYFEDTPKELREYEAAPGSDPLRPMMDRGMPDFTELRYRMKVAPAAHQPEPEDDRAGDNATLKAPFTRYTISFSLSTEGLTLEAGPDGVRRGNIEVALVAYSQAGEPLNWEARTIGLKIRPEQNAMAQTSGIPLHFDIDAPRGDVYLRSGIYDLNSSRAGTLEIPLTSITVARQ